MRDYHRKGCEISRGVYYQVKGILMDYDKMKKDRIDILYGSCNAISGMPHSSDIGNPTEQRALRLAYIDDHLHAIGQASVLMRAERGDKVGVEFDPIRGYWSYNYFNCQHERTPESPDGPCRRTWNNFKDRFSFVIAQNLKIY